MAGRARFGPKPDTLGILVKKRIVLQAIASALIFAACGGRVAPTMQPATPLAAPSPTATVRPPATDLPSAIPTAAPATTSQPTSTASAPAATAPPTRIALTFKGIEQGLTADGFPYLGKADAPITLTDYSDFL